MSTSVRDVPPLGRGPHPPLFQQVASVARRGRYIRRVDLSDLTPEQLADLRHLRNLLDLLPEDDEKQWWNELNDVVAKARNGFGADEYIKSNVTLVREMLRYVLDERGDRFKLRDVLRQALYVTLLDVNDAAVARCIGYRIVGAAWAGPEHGRRWLNDVGSTAWRLHVSLAPYGGLNGPAIRGL
jgi:hypothetical protein